MFRVTEFMVRRCGIIGLLNLNATFGLIISVVLVQSVRHGDVFRWLTLKDLFLIILVAVCLNAWLVGGLYRDWRSDRD